VMILGGTPPTGAVGLKPGRLTTDAQAGNQVLVPLRVTALQVFQKAAAPRDHRQQSPAGMMIFAVRLEVILELHNTLAQNRDLNFWRTGIRPVNSVRGDYLLLGIGFQGHSRIDTPRLNLISFLSFTAYHSLGRRLLAVDSSTQNRARSRGTHSPRGRARSYPAAPHRNRSNCVTLGVFRIWSVCCANLSTELLGDRL
jgi:hypothetical protein